MKPFVNIVKSKQGGTITISGILTVKYAKALMAALQEIPETTIHLEIDNPTEIDLSALQIVWAFRKKMRVKNPAFTTSFNLQEKDRLLLQRTGFETLSIHH